VDHSVPTLDAGARHWRKAALIVSAVAAVELLLLIAIGVITIGRPLLHDAQAGAERKARATPAHAKPKPARATPVPKPRPRPPAPPKLSRHQTSVLVLNGNGVEGAAGAEAQVVRSHDYVIAGVGNARRANYPRSLVMYRPDFRAEGLRLARDLGIGSATPLDGLRKAELHGAHAVVIVGG
jgi:hypothetical protein